MPLFSIIAILVHVIACAMGSVLGAIAKAREDREAHNETNAFSSYGSETQPPIRLDGSGISNSKL